MKPSLPLQLRYLKPSQFRGVAPSQSRHHQHQQRLLTTTTTPRRPTPRTRTRTEQTHQTRPFLSSLFNPPNPSNNSNSNSNNNSNNNNNNNPNARTLTATKTLPYNPPPLFNVISSVSSYADFLPFLSESTVTARDPNSGLPTRATLVIGYGPFSERFSSEVVCDPRRWVVEARSGDGSRSGNGEVFEYLSTKWVLTPVPGEKEKEKGQGQGQGQGQARTKVDLEIQFAFKNSLHAAMFSAVEGQMAGVMVEAFEKRVREVEG